MTTFSIAIDGYIACKELDRASITRLMFWRDALGDKECADISGEDIEDALSKLAKRGRLKGGRGIATTKVKKPLQPSTVNRYLNDAGSIFIHQKELRHLPRHFASPTKGIKRAAERADPERYIRPEEFATLLDAARVIDRTWRKMPALMTVAYHTGLRVGNLVSVRWRDVNLNDATIFVARTKNADPITGALSTAAVAELRKLPKGKADEIIFAGRDGKPFVYRMLWMKVAAAAKMKDKVFHELRHGHGYELAKAGVSQQMIMKSMGHRTLRASERYAHANTADKQAIIARVFG